MKKHSNVGYSVTHNTSDIQFFPSDHFSNNSPESNLGPTVRLNADTKSPDLVSNSTGWKAQSPKAVLTSDSSHQSQVVACTSGPLAVSWELP